MTDGADVLGRKHLTVLNRTGPSSPSHFLLEDPGTGDSSAAGDPAVLEEQVILALKAIYDPEIPLNIYDLGLIYQAVVSREGRAEIAMTLTSPGCPVAGVLVQQVHDAVRRVPGISWVRTEIVWDPPWTKERMSDAARLALGLL